MIALPPAFIFEDADDRSFQRFPARGVGKVQPLSDELLVGRNTRQMRLVVLPGEAVLMIHLRACDLVVIVELDEQFRKAGGESDLRRSLRQPPREGIALRLAEHRFREHDHPIGRFGDAVREVTQALVFTRRELHEPGKKLLRRGRKRAKRLARLFFEQGKLLLGEGALVGLHHERRAVIKHHALGDRPVLVVHRDGDGEPEQDERHRRQKEHDKKPHGFLQHPVRADAHRRPKREFRAPECGLHCFAPLRGRAVRDDEPVRHLEHPIAERPRELLVVRDDDDEPVLRERLQKR